MNRISRNTFISRVKVQQPSGRVQRLACSNALSSRALPPARSLVPRIPKIARGPVRVFAGDENARVGGRRCESRLRNFTSPLSKEGCDACSRGRGDARGSAVRETDGGTSGEVYKPLVGRSRFCSASRLHTRITHSNVSILTIYPIAIHHAYQRT